MKSRSRNWCADTGIRLLILFIECLTITTGPWSLHKKHSYGYTQAHLATRRTTAFRLISIESPLTLRSASFDGEAIELDPPDLNVLQDEALIENERRLAVARAITSLPQKYRAAIVLRDVEGLSYDQIAQTLQLSEGTVKSRINRARNLLKEKLSAYM